MAAGPSGDRRGAGAGDHQRDDRAGLVRRGVRAPLDERPAPGPRRHGPVAARQRPVRPTGTRGTTSPGMRSPASRSPSIRRRAAATSTTTTGSPWPGRSRCRPPTAPVACRPAFDLLAEQCRAFPPTVAEEITGVPAADIERAAQVLWEHRPVAFYTWSGLEQHSGTTQIIRAINVLYALTGCFDAPGGNVLFTPVPTNPIAGDGAARPGASGRRRSASASGRSARPASGSSPARTSTPRRWRAVPYRPARARQLRVEPADGPRRQRPRPGRAADARLPRPPRPVHEPDRRTGRHRAAGDRCLRGRGTEGRLRDLPGGPVAGAAAHAAGAAGGRGPPGHRGHLRPRHPARARRALLRRRASTPAGRTSSSRAASRSSSSEPIPPVSACRWRPATGSTRRPATTAYPPGSPRPRGGSSCTSRPSSTSDSRRSPRSPSRR